ncbi:SDR family NAD(P)-dependent oxidoreductase [Novipirellula artificiosorum]|uniref:Glucose 1-dehydrogenase 4 n=1 Tax=Novipirellula artificiosorum TaxID=2528016 RepID=A0A5C6DWR0_9BACT|nr:SDR family oxidoreductase [Novipirellula artificiosorum]TWU41088.1 Glucose 1-dehydrogenase 4 [Novipirellula artificiosorum]
MRLLQQTFDCDAPVALVTGSGAPRVGRAIADWLAKLQCRIALHANSSTEQSSLAADQIRQRYNVDVIVTQGALQEEGVGDRIVSQTVDHFGRIDILVNSAAIWHPTPLESVTADEVRRYFDINSLGTFLCSRAAGLRMVEQPSGGSIINLGDWATVRPYLDHAAYFPSKGSIEVMTRSLAVELGARNHRVRVNCLQPGPVLLGDDVDADQRERIANSTLVERIGTPENIAHAVQFLCENDFITGVCLPVDGGRSVYAPDGLQVGMNTG